MVAIRHFSSFSCYSIFLIVVSNSLAADQILFNSNYNRNSFIKSIRKVLNIATTELKNCNVESEIDAKCFVIYYPIAIDQLNLSLKSSERCALHLVWPHRWEHDKNPELLSATLQKLDAANIDFVVSIIGERSTVIPTCFVELQEKLGKKLHRFGYLTRDEYFECLCDADIVVSTADHEFYGVSMYAKLNIFDEH